MCGINREQWNSRRLVLVNENLCKMTAHKTKAKVIAFIHARQEVVADDIVRKINKASHEKDQQQQQQQQQTGHRFVSSQYLAACSHLALKRSRRKKTKCMSPRPPPPSLRLGPHKSIHKIWPSVLHSELLSLSNTDRWAFAVATKWHAQNKPLA